MTASYYMSCAYAEYAAVGSAWQKYSDVIELGLDANAAVGHPDFVIAALIANPELRGPRAKNIRSVHKFCKDRFDRGERDFTMRALNHDALASGTLRGKTGEAPLKLSGYAELITAWQKLATDRLMQERAPPGATSVPTSTCAREPDTVLAALLQYERLASGTANRLKRMHEICQARYVAGEVDFTRSVGAD